MSELKPDPARMSEDEPEVEGHRLKVRDDKYEAPAGEDGGDEGSPEVEGMRFSAHDADDARSESSKYEKDQ